MSDEDKLVSPLVSRRDLIKTSCVSAGYLLFGELVLRADALPTEESGKLGSYGQYMAPVKAVPKPAAVIVPKKAAPQPAITEDNILGPFYRPGAPFRAKITPPLERGKVVVVSGHVFGFDTKGPLKNAVIDVWQANANGRYDNDDPSKPPKADVFLNRARMITDEQGYYEYETIHPGRYQIGSNVWRPSHIHYMVQAPGYKSLVTQLYFQGDPENKRDSFIKQSLIVSFGKRKIGEQSIETGTFDIVLAAK